MKRAYVLILLSCLLHTLCAAQTEIVRITTEPKAQEVISPDKIDSIRHARPKRSSTSMELGLSYLLFLNERDNLPHYNDFAIWHGVGISLLPEVKKIKSPFSFLTGLALQYILINNFKFQTNGGFDNGSLNKGYQVRMEMPFSFRLTYGQKLRYFFQTGFSGGIDIYRGWGYGYSYLGHCSSCSSSSSGWLGYTSGFINPLILSGGIRTQISNGVELISSIAASPINIQFSDGPTPQPYMQVHLGFNFSSKPVGSVGK